MFSSETTDSAWSPKIRGRPDDHELPLAASRRCLLVSPHCMQPTLSLRLVFAVFASFACFVGDLFGASKPNVLFLFADDMRYDSIGALGNPVAKTPTLDSLVQRGFVFNNAYCLGGNSPAVCTPSRNMLLSGKAYFRWKDFVPPGGKANGSIAPGDAPNWPLTMQAAGYETYHQGKKGNSATLIQAKFEHNLYINENEDRTCGEPGKMISDDVVKFLVFVD